jgi:hypothetical protein
LLRSESTSWRVDVKPFRAAAKLKFYAMVDRRPPIRRYPGNQGNLTVTGIQETPLATPSKEARERAEQKFRKKEIEARDASKAMAEYQAGLVAQREKTARLRALREAKEAAERAARAAQPAGADADEAGAPAHQPRGKAPARA